nr:C40 family peptidase [Clostridiales bacterium]
MRRIIPILAALAVMSAVFIPPAQLEAAGDKTILYGDLDLDGILDMNDVEIMTSLLAGDNQTQIPEKQALLRADINEDGVFDARDIALAAGIVSGVAETPERRHTCSFHRDEYVEPTCTFAGHWPWRCTRCGIIYYEAVEAPSGHSWKSKAVHRPKCEERGYSAYFCSECGARYVADYEEAKGHKWEITEVVEPTCQHDGYTEFTCYACGGIKRDLFTETAGRHDYQLKVLQDGGRQTAWYVCSWCGDKVKAPENLQPALPSLEQPSDSGEDAEETEEPEPPTIPKGVDYNQDGIVAIDEYLGAGDIVSYLTEHYNDYYGTRYISIRDNYRDPHRCLHPKGLYPNSPGLNCTGFVASVFENAGADLSRVPNRADGTGMSGDYANGYNWRNMVNMAELTVYRFSTIREALSSGRMQKGDVIYFQPKYRGDDCHMGIFWGDTPYDDKIFHSIAKGCVVTNIKCAQAYAYMWVIPITHS